MTSELERKARRIRDRKRYEADPEYRTKKIESIKRYKGALEGEELEQYKQRRRDHAREYYRANRDEILEKQRQRRKK